MQAGAVNLIDCKSCGVKNTSAMSFCIQCGKVLSSSVEALRQARDVKKRTCPSCQRYDELNNRKWALCGSELKVFVGRNTNPVALAKFSDELHSLTEPPPSPTQSFTSLPAMEPVLAPEIRKSGPRVDFFLLMGLCAGIALPFLIGTATLAQVAFSTQLPGSGLVIFTDKPNAEVVLESVDRKSYILGQTSPHGVFYAGDLPGATYRLRLSLPGCRTLMQKLELVKDRLNTLGFDKPLVLPRSSQAAGGH